MRRKKPAVARAPPGPIQIRAQTSAVAAASAISTGWKTIWNWGTPKSNSAWKVESPISSPPISPARRSRTTSAGLAAAAAPLPGPHALDQQDRLSDQGQRGASDQHQVGRSPEGHVLPEEAVPEVIEREAEQREEGAGRDQTPPSGAYQPRLIRTAVGPGRSSGRAIATNPEQKIPKRPARIR